MKLTVESHDMRRDWPLDAADTIKRFDWILNGMNADGVRLSVSVPSRGHEAYAFASFQATNGKKAIQYAFTQEELESADNPYEMIERRLRKMISAVKRKEAK